MKSSPSKWKHLKAILILPFTVIIIIPYLLQAEFQNQISQLVNLNPTILKVIGIMILIPGLWLFIKCIWLFHNQGKGTLAPWDPTSQLVVIGAYAHSRNPMITSVLFMLLSRSLISNNVAILIWAGIFFLVNNIYFIVSEEPGLEKRFGSQYREYKSNVPRWIPRIKAWKQKHYSEKGS